MMPTTDGANRSWRRTRWRPGGSTARPISAVARRGATCGTSASRPSTSTTHTGGVKAPRRRSRPRSASIPPRSCTCPRPTEAPGLESQSRLRSGRCLTVTTAEHLESRAPVGPTANDACPAREVDPPRGGSDRRLAIVAIFLVALSPLVVGALAIVQRGFPEGALFGDRAILGLTAGNAWRAPVLLGPYSRFYWHHPGPVVLLRPQRPEPCVRRRHRRARARRGCDQCGRSNGAPGRRAPPGRTCAPRLGRHPADGVPVRDRSVPIRHLEPERDDPAVRPRPAPRVVGDLSRLVGGAVAGARRIVRGADARRARARRRGGSDQRSRAVRRAAASHFRAPRRCRARQVARGRGDQRGGRVRGVAPAGHRGADELTGQPHSAGALLLPSRQPAHPDRRARQHRAPGDAHPPGRAPLGVVAGGCPPGSGAGTGPERAGVRARVRRGRAGACRGTRWSS